MSAFERLPKEYRDECARTAANSRMTNPRNKRVMLGTDLFLASRKDLPNTMTRQQRRAAERERMKRTKR